MNYERDLSKTYNSLEDQYIHLLFGFDAIIGEHQTHIESRLKDKLRIEIKRDGHGRNMQLAKLPDLFTVTFNLDPVNLSGMR